VTLFLSLAVAVGVGLSSGPLPAEYDYGALVNQALTDCKNSRGKEIDPDLLWQLVAVEGIYNPAPEVRGMILAAACMESGFNPDATGDRKFSKSGKKPMAVGILQMWKIYEKMYGTDRLDPISAAHGWMKHIARMVPKVVRQCKYKSPRKVWVAAWVTGIRYKKKDGRCKEKPKHLRILKRWQKNIKKLQQRSTDE
jgi:hypothetical protein